MYNDTNATSHQDSKTMYISQVQTKWETKRTENGNHGGAGCYILRQQIYVSIWQASSLAATHAKARSNDSISTDYHPHFLRVANKYLHLFTIQRKIRKFNRQK